MKRTVQTTADGSSTISIDAMNVTYHSRHGALQESRHVFIDAGLRHTMEKFADQPICIFEMGFGTGLNALLSLEFGQLHQRSLYYFSVEQFPLLEDEWQQLSYGHDLSMEREFALMHTSPWNKDVMMGDAFLLHKHEGALLQLQTEKRFHLVYYDAFAPAAQPELWTQTVFQQMLQLLLPGGCLVTYCSKGDVRRAMLAAGFSVEKIPGPPGKREMLRANRPLI